MKQALVVKACAALLPCAVGVWACGVPNAESPWGPTSELPVTRVVLYQNGVGYFERSGSVDGDMFTLQVRPSQINDLLKSLTVIDAGSGRAVSASLPLEQSADRLLSELPEQVRNAGGLLEVLRLFRGARVEIEGSAGRAAGRVIGVENLQAESGAEVAADWRLSLKTPDDAVIVYPVNAVRTITLADSTLSVGLERSLDVSLGEGGWKPIGLSIRLAGDAPHRVVASYIVEMPRWKPAYRLVLSGKDQPLLQGWAVVDNVSGEHWHDVSLSLVSGTPISFKYNLHAPQYTERADLTPAGLPRAAAPPPSEEAGYAEAPPPPMAPAPMRPAPSVAAGAGPGGDARRAKKSADRERSMMEEGYPYSGDGAEYDRDEAAEAGEVSAPPPPPMDAALESQGGQAEASQVGTLFRYDIRDHVTIPDRSSTLVNIVNQRIAGEEVMYFRPELSPGLLEIHPYRAVKFDNATGSTLERGPITVYSNGTFVGEGFVERMEQGSTSFLTFAIDGKVSLDQKGGMREEGWHLLRIQNGQIVTEAQQVQVTTYEVTSRREEPVRAYIKTLKTSGWTLKERPSGTVETPDSLIVPLDVPAGKSAKIEVAWMQPVTRSMAIDSAYAGDVLSLYLAGGKAPPALAQLIKQLLDLKGQIAEKQKEESRLAAQHATLSRDLERVRDNINVLRRTRGNAALEQELAQKLGKLERDLGGLSGRRVALSEGIAELEAKLRSLIKDVTLDATPQ